MIGNVILFLVVFLAVGALMSLAHRSGYIDGIRDTEESFERHYRATQRAQRTELPTNVTPLFREPVTPWDNDA